MQHSNVSASDSYQPKPMSEAARLRIRDAVTTKREFPTSIMSQHPTSVLFKDMTARMLTIATHMHTLRAESAVLEQASKEKPLTQKQYERYLAIGAIFENYDSFFGDVTEDPKFFTINTTKA